MGYCIVRRRAFVLADVGWPSWNRHPQLPDSAVVGGVVVVVVVVIDPKNREACIVAFSIFWEQCAPMPVVWPPRTASGWRGVPTIRHRHHHYLMKMEFGFGSHPRFSGDDWAAFSSRWKKEMMIAVYAARPCINNYCCCSVVPLFGSDGGRRRRNMHKRRVVTAGTVMMYLTPMPSSLRQSASLWVGMPWCL